MVSSPALGFLSEMFFWHSLMLAKKLVESNNYSLTYILGFVNNGVPVVLKTQLPDGPTEKRDSDAIAIVKAGQHGLFEAASGAFYLSLLHEIGLFPMLNMIVNMQARAHAFVHGPVDIFRLTAGGGEWIQKKRECRERG